jgi:hypothetical protein
VEITNVAGRLLNAVAPPDARFFAVEGTFSVSTGAVRCVRVIDGQTGADLWTRPVANKPDYALLALDPGGGTLAYNPMYHGDLRETALVDLHTGLITQRFLGVAGGLGPGGEWFVRLGDRELSEQGFSMHRTVDNSLLLAFRLHAEHSDAPPRINRAGTRLAWAHSDGTVVVANLPEVRNRLLQLRNAANLMAPENK